MFNQNLEDNLLMGYHKDGIIDMAIGVMLLIAGVLLLLDQIVFGTVAFLLLLPVMQSLKRTITLPRVKPADLPSDMDLRLRYTRLLIVGLITFLLVAGLFVLRMADNDTPLNPQLLMWGIATLVALLLLAVTFITRNWRLLGYGLGGILLFFLGQAVNLALPFVLMVLGGVALVAGSIILVQFMNSHPPLLSL